MDLVERKCGGGTGPRFQLDLARRLAAREELAGLPVSGLVLVSDGADTSEAAVSEALGYLDQTLAHGFRPGMGHVLPDRLFWAQPTPDEEEAEEATDEADAGLPHLLQQGCRMRGGAAVDQQNAFG